MNLVKLTEFLIESIIIDCEGISVKEYPTDEEIKIEVLVPEDQMGIVIGKKGKTINAIRTLVQVAAYKNNLKHVFVDVQSY